jgi:hypothetical protein
MWDTLYFGGAMNYLSDLDLHKFEDVAAEQSRQFNYMTNLPR